MPRATHRQALGGVLLGLAALAGGRGPPISGGDPYHPIMLILVAASLGVLYLVWSTRKRTGGVNSSNSNEKPV